MVDESIPARRPALSLFAPRRARRSSPLFSVKSIGTKLAAALAVALVAPALGLASGAAANAVAAPTTVGVATATGDGPLTLDLSPAGSPIVRPGQDLQVIATVTNGGADAIEAGNIDVYLAGRALTTQAALDSWFEADSSDSVSDLLVSAPLTSSILPGNSATLAITVPSAELGLTEQNAWGARGIAAKLDEDDTATAEGRSTFVWYPTETVTPVNFSLVMPITTPAGSVGIIPATALETYTGPNGLLTRQLDGVIDTPVTLGIDPMIIASIRILGTEAPASALAWLDRLAHATNETFPLSYADADIALGAQTSGTIRGPISFAHALDPSAFVTTPPVISPDSPASTPQSLGARSIGSQLPSSLLAESSTATPDPTPTPTSTEPATNEPTLPTTEDLLAWTYSTTTIGWPAVDSVSSSDLAVFAANGLTTTILSESQVTRTDSSTTPSATVTTEGGVGVVAADGLSAAVNRAVMATTEEEWHSGIAEAASQLAVAAANQSGRQSVVAALDRGWPPTATRLNQTIATLLSMPWQASISLQQASAEAVDTNATVKSQSEDATRVELGSRLVASEVALTDFASAIANPLALTAPERLSQLALFATSWIDDQDAWTDAVGLNLTGAQTVLNSVVVTTKGPINVFAAQVDIPITLTNEFDQDVTVRLNLQPTNARLVVGDDVVETIDANSARSIRIPVSAKVGNGEVTLRATVYSPTGVQLGEPTLIDVNVQAEWEGVGAIIFAVAVVLFFGFGVWRNITGRRKRRDQPDDNSDAATTMAAEPDKTVTAGGPSIADDTTTSKDTPVTDDSTKPSATDDTRE